MARHDPIGARDELRERIKAKLEAGNDEAPGLLADRVMTLFYRVEDWWEQLDVTTLGEPGESFVENRYLLAYAPVQGFSYTRPVDRTVT